VRTIAERLAGEAAVVQVDTQANPALAARFGVRGIPVLMLLRGGKVVDQLAGAQPVEAVVAWFRRNG
jgi:thioredoxin 2